jgi:drug/metabolite transporter (DMT)-like permease
MLDRRRDQGRRAGRFGSVVAFSAYTWLLERCPATLVATHTYVNPVIAVLLGWLFAGERLTPRVIGATGLILSAVLLLKSSTAQRRTQSGEGLCPPQGARADRDGA